MHQSIIIACILIEMSSSISSCMFGCTCMHRQHGAGAARTAAAAAAASTAERRCRPAGASGSCTRAPTARKSHSKSFTWRPAASTRRAQRPRRPPSLYPLSHAVYDTVPCVKEGMTNKKRVLLEVLSKVCEPRCLSLHTGFRTAVNRSAHITRSPKLNQETQIAGLHRILLHFEFS